MNEIATTETEPAERMCVTSIKVRNAKGCELVELDMDGHPMTIIGGGNASGKSSFIHGFCWALGGKGLIPPDPIKHGEQKTEIEVKLDGATNMLPWPCVVRRTITRRRDGTLKHELEIVPEDGSKAPSPQTLIDDLLGKDRFGFDALKFGKEKPVIQAQMLSKLLGLDFTKLNYDRQVIYERRAIVKKAVQDIGGELSRTPVHDDAPEERISVAGLVAELSSITDDNTKTEQLARDRRAQIDGIRQQQTTLEEFQRRGQKSSQKADHALDRAENYARQIVEKGKNDARQIVEKARNDAREAVEDAEIAARQIVEKGKNECELTARRGDEDVARVVTKKKQMERVLSEMPAEIPAVIDPLPVESKLMNVESLNQKYDDMQKRADIAKQKEGQESLVAELTDQIKDLDDEKERQTQEVEWPIEGLGFGNLGLIYKGTLLHELATSEQERVGVAIALRINPKFPFVIIRDGSLLEHARVATVAKMVHELGGQCLMERVSLGDECHVILKEGRAATAEEIADMREQAAANPIEEPTDEK